MKTETERTNILCAALRKYNAIILVNHASGRTSPDWPDRYISHPRWHGWIEFKNPKTNVTDGQKRVLAELRRADERQAYVGRFVRDFVLTFEDEEGREFAVAKGSNAHEFAGHFLKVLEAL